MSASVPPDGGRSPGVGFAGGEFSALIEAVCGGEELGLVQRCLLVGLLFRVEFAAELAPRARELYPDDPHLAAVFAAEAWEPVAKMHAELVAAMRS